MKNKCITLFFITVCLQAHTLVAKNDSTSVIKNGIGISVGPMLSIPTNVNQNNYANFSVVSKGGLGASAALCENIVLSKKQNFYLYTELGYQTIAFTNTYTNGSVNTTYNSLVASKDIYQDNYGYFQLSLQKVLFHVAKKFGLFIGVGGQASYNYSSSSTLVETVVTANGQTTTNTYYGASSIHSGYSQNQLQASALARIGFLINPVKHLSINIAPVFNYSVYHNNSYNTFGLNLQLLYNF
ncbi:MAG TPA: hypothetical protein VK835_00570 [Bacteroidia bacterium]|nr:hypothetical protein [Bacteroidia bacterium]